MLGQELPTGGSLEINGRPVGFPDPSRGIVFQRYSLFPHLTVLENVSLGRRLRAGLAEGWRRRAEFRDEALHYLERVRLADNRSATRIL